MSTATELIRSLAQQGVNLRVDGEQLIVQAPKGSVASETMERLKEQKAAVMAELAAPSGVRFRRQEVLQMMADDDRPRSHYWKTFDKAHPDFVILAFAIRGVGTGELSIPREKYDPFLLMEILDKHQAGGTDS